MKYESSELYKLHSDYAKEHREQLHGVRLLTFLVYLDDVEDGGGTNFPQLNITVQPKRGRALLWPNVLDEDPNAEEKRTQHQSLPVNKGVKRITTTYIYQRDFKKPYVRHCII
jgi:prolyl 4-hydroxylase